jgi:hypothetical protein
MAMLISRTIARLRYRGISAVFGDDGMYCLKTPSFPRRRESSPYARQRGNKFMSPPTRLLLDSRLRGNDGLAQ